MTRRARVIDMPAPPPLTISPQTWGELLAMKDMDGNYIYSDRWIVTDRDTYVARCNAELERRENEK